MRKFLNCAVYVLVAAFFTLTFSRCETKHDCKMYIKCNFTSNGVDTLGSVANAHIVVGEDHYNARARAEGYTDANGVFIHTFELPALLNVLATYSDTIKDEAGNVTAIKNYSGGTQVQLYEGETTEKTILMVELL